MNAYKYFDDGYEIRSVYLDISKLFLITFGTIDSIKYQNKME